MGNLIIHELRSRWKGILGWQIVAAKTLAIGVALIVILLLVGLGDAAVLAAIKTSYDTAVMPINLFLVLLSAWPITMAFRNVTVGEWPWQRAQVPRKT